MVRNRYNNSSAFQQVEKTQPLKGRVFQLDRSRIYVQRSGLIQPLISQHGEGGGLLLFFFPQFVI